ncbi:MAG: putative tellurium resistance membrane protein TerC [Myxococcota bacterium]|jgi:predicted tellurium resistance membrane protein TerC
MGDLLTVDNFLTLLMLIFLQAVLGFDNLLYISLESKRVAADKQQMVRRIGIGLAIGLRLVLLFVVVSAISAFQTELFGIHTGLFSAAFTGHSLIVLVGGIFIIYTAVKEISHMLSIEHIEGEGSEATTRSPGTAIAWIVVMNLVFSFDSILSALALTDVFAVMAIAIVVSGVMMIVLADTVADFLKKNRMYEVLGLFVLFIVGIMLVSEGGHLAHIHLLDHPVEPMAKSTFYFTLIVLVFVDIAQGRYQKKLNLERKNSH